MNKKIIILLISLQSISLYGTKKWYNPLTWGSRNAAAVAIDPTKFHYGVATQNAVEASIHIENASENLYKTAVIIDKLASDPEKAKHLAYDITTGVLQATGAVVGAAAVSAKDAVVIKVTATAVAAKASTIAAAGAAKTATIASATVAAPYVAGAVVVGGVGYGGYRLHRMLAEPTEEYHRCLNDNLDCADLNARGFPKRCDSPERKAWNYMGAKTVREGHFQTLKAELQAAKAKA